MESVLLVIHLFLALAIIGLVLLQRSEGGGLGIGGGGGGAGGMGNLASPRGTANFLTKATAFCAAAFFCTSLILGILAGTHHQDRQGILAGMNTPAAEENVEGATDENVEPVIPDAPVDGDADGVAITPDQNQEAPAAPIAE